MVTRLRSVDLSELLIEEKDDDEDAELEFMSDDSDCDDFHSDVGSDSEIDGDLFRWLS